VDQQNEVLSRHQVKMSFKSDSNAEMPLILAQMPIYFDSLGVQDLYAQHRALGADNEAIEKEFGDGE
jgi:hypothetical protein